MRQLAICPLEKTYASFTVVPGNCIVYECVRTCGHTCSHSYCHCHGDGDDPAIGDSIAPGAGHGSAHRQTDAHTHCPRARQDVDRN